VHQVSISGWFDKLNDTTNPKITEQLATKPASCPVRCPSLSSSQASLPNLAYYGPRFPTNIYTRGVPLSFTPLLRLKRCYACDPMAFFSDVYLQPLTFTTVNYVAILKVLSFSHFLPRKELLGPAGPPQYLNFSRVAGCVLSSLSCASHAPSHAKPLTGAYLPACLPAAPPFYHVSSQHFTG
jgi:hypothetical protein